MTQYYGQYAPDLLATKYAKEMWALYEEGELTPDTELTGHFEESDEAADVDSVVQEIKAVMEEERERRERMSEADEED
jgi:RIO kinase 1